ncbi:MAG: folylpolyglutamate synthase/dihydrofolate synthase family protein [Balneolaceae bacterium]
MFSKVGDKASKFGLDTITQFCERIGNPQNKFKSIHVAGTNGKGSTCYLLESVYKQAGFKTGMFTSPHLLRYNERIQISGEEVSDDLILEFFQKTEPALLEIPLTYFEISTALAFWVFKKEQVDLAIIETGLGGRLDSTNIINPELSIITSIGKDHEQVLGDTVKKIAFEKAGIIKSNTPIIIGKLDKASMEIVEQKAAKEKAPLFKSEELNPAFDYGNISFEANKKVFKTNLIEPINAWNVAMLYQSVEVLRPQFIVSESSFKEALKSFKGIPARFEKLHQNKKWYFSGAHNEQAIDAMMEAVNRIPSTRKLLILSMMKDKLNKEIFSKFESFDQVFYFEQEGERAANYSEIKKFIEAKKVDENNIKKILNELQTELVIFAGSFYFYSTIKRWLNKNTEKP